MTWVGYLCIDLNDPLYPTLVNKLFHCSVTFIDPPGGYGTARPQLDACVASLRPKDTLVLARLDHFPRWPRYLHRIMDHFTANSIELQVINPTITSHSDSGRTMRSMIAFFDIDALHERTERQRTGLARARTRGTPMGRPLLLNPDQIRDLQQRRQQGDTIRTLITTYTVSKATVYRALNTPLPELESEPTPPPPVDPAPRRRPPLRRRSRED